MNTITETKVRLFASAKCWIENEALRQLYAASRLEDVRQVVGFPDLHPGKGSAVGASVVTTEKLYPHLIGGDIGCGMGLWKTGLLHEKARLKQWAAIRFDLEHPWEGDVSARLKAAGLEPTAFDDELGTIGDGNHFAELQAVEKIFDAWEFSRLGLGKDELAVLVHSGSRGVGEVTLRGCVDEHRGDGLEPDSNAAAEYLREHDVAVQWAQANRNLIAERFINALGGRGARLWDACHNRISASETEGARLWVHRRGATAADAGPVVIPGSRGALSYLVLPLGDGEANAWSISHGAGRKWTRSVARSRMRERFHASELMQTPLGGRVICEQRDLLYEEAPAAYKNIEAVVEALVDAGIASVIATFRPLLTYKTRVLRR